MPLIVRFFYSVPYFLQDNKCIRKSRMRYTHFAVILLKRHPPLQKCNIGNREMVLGVYASYNSKKWLSGDILVSENSFKMFTMYGLDLAIF